MLTVQDPLSRTSPQNEGFQAAPCEKNWCMEMNTTVTPIKKLSVRECPNRAADMMPVTMVAIVDEYFLRMVSAYLKKKEDRIPWSALFITNNMVTCTHWRLLSAKLCSTICK